MKTTAARMNAAKRAGRAFEAAVVGWLVANGWPYAERRALRGIRDGGDVAGIPGLCIEVKATKSIDLATALTEAEAEAAACGAEVWVAVIKRRRSPVGRAYAVTTLEQYGRLLAEAGR